METLQHQHHISRIDALRSPVAFNVETSAGICINDEPDHMVVEYHDLDGLASGSNSNRPLLDDDEEDEFLEHFSPPDSEASDFMELQNVSIIAKDKDCDKSLEYTVHSSKILIKEGSKHAEGGDYSSSSEGTMDNQNSGQTHPETPPTPLSFESRTSSQSSTASSGSGIVLLQSPSNGELPPHILSIPLSGSNCNNPHSLKMSLSGNRLPNRVRRSRTEIMGRSIFSCLNGDADTISPSNSSGNHKDVFRRRPEKINSCDSEEALEMAAQKIRNQLLLTEMVELAAKAERAADSGYDRFTGYPLCVFPEDLPEQHRHRRRRRCLAPSMRRSFSEGAYAPTNSGTASPRRLPSNSSAVSELFPSASMTTIPIPELHKLDAAKFRDINDVVPKFSSFHRHLRTHFFRSEVLHEQLLFQEGLVPVPDTSKEHPVLARSNSEDAMSLLPICSNEITATPLPPVRKTATPSSPLSSIPPPIHGFLKHFRLDHPWAVAPNATTSSTGDSPASSEDPISMDRRVIDVLSNQICKSQTPQVPKVDVLPGLEGENYVPRTAIRLQPKIDRRSIFTGANEASQELGLYPDAAHSVVYLNVPAKASRALLDEIECDSFDEYDSLYADQFDSLGLPRNQLMMPHPTNPDDSSSSLLDDPVLILTPPMGKMNFHERRNSIVLPDEDEVNGIPVAPMIPDFVTPVFLRKIRGSAFVPSVVLPMHLTEETTNSVPLEACPVLPIAVEAPPSIHVEPMVSPLDISSDTADEVVRQFTTQSCRETLKESKGLDDSLAATVTTETTTKISDSSSFNPPSEGTVAHPETAELPFHIPKSRDVPVVSSMKDDKNGENAHAASELPVLPKSIGRRFGGLANSPGNEAWGGCLSFSPELTPISAAENGMKRNETLAKSPSTGALDDLKSWNEFVEQFAVKGQSNHSARSTSVPRHSIREAMELLSSQLSPKKCHRYDSKRRALYARMKENDEFMSNFLYCSKPIVGDAMNVTMDDVPPTKGFLCIDGSIACGGDTSDAAGYCCTTSWLEDALHLGRWRPPPRGVTHRSAPPPLGSSWLDLAPLDARLEPGMGRTPWRTETGSVAFQAPSLKKTRNLWSSRNLQNRNHSQWMHAQTWDEDHLPLEAKSDV
jgi:hypothetical protein